jgi:hypothetical protein
MCVVQSIGQDHRRSRVKARTRALCQAWAAYALKRAITDVASTSEQDYLAFGLDKAEILAALAQLRDEVGGRGQPADHARPYGISRFAIKVGKRFDPLPSREPLSPLPGQSTG